MLADRGRRQGAGRRPEPGPDAQHAAGRARSTWSTSTADRAGLRPRPRRGAGRRARPARRRRARRGGRRRCRCCAGAAAGRPPGHPQPRHHGRQPGARRPGRPRCPPCSPCSAARSSWPWHGGERDVAGGGVLHRAAGVGLRPGELASRRLPALPPHRHRLRRGGSAGTATTRCAASARWSRSTRTCGRVGPARPTSRSARRRCWST